MTTPAPADLSAALPPLSVAGRLDRARTALTAADVEGRRPDALLVTTPANIRWLTGFTGSAGVLMVTGGGALLATDGRYRTQAAEQLAAAGAAADVALSVGGVTAQRDALAEAAGPAAAVGLEAADVTWAAVTTWREVLAPRELVPLRDVVEGLRTVKDAGEVARMERAAAIADAALGSVLPLLATAADGAPLTESQFAAAHDHAMRTHGAEDRAFETIVASGPNSAKPHARPGDRRIGRGDPVVVDFGATFDGYRSDMTRTFCVGGAPSGELAVVFDVAAASQRAGVAAVAPGVAAGDVDRV